MSNQYYSNGTIPYWNSDLNTQMAVFTASAQNVPTSVLTPITWIGYGGFSDFGTSITWPSQNPTYGFAGIDFQEEMICQITGNIGATNGGGGTFCSYNMRVVRGGSQIVIANSVQPTNGVNPLMNAENINAWFKFEPGDTLFIAFVQDTGSNATIDVTNTNLSILRIS